MMELFYIISMAVAFTYKYDGVMVSYWVKYIIAGIWIAAWLFDVIRKGGILQGTPLFYLKKYLAPVILLCVLSLILWIINTPPGFNGEYCSRSLSQLLCLAIAMLSPVATCYFFGRRTIQLSVYAIALSTAFNVIRAIQVYGFDIFITFMKSAWIVDFDVTRPTYRISQMLEVHDATLACGFYLIYYIFFCEKKQKGRLKNIILVSLAIYIGFKRVAFVGVAIVALAILILRYKEESFEKIIKITAVGVSALAVVYIVSIKTGLLETLSIALNIDFSGRFLVYDKMSKMMSLLPTYLGTGYGYLNKYLGDTTGLASHSDIVRMYIELGFIPYLIWMFYYLWYIPTRVYRRFGADAGRVIVASTLYVFITYFVGNAMTMFCIQYSFVLLPIALSYGKETENKRGRRITFGAGGM